MGGMITGPRVVAAAVGLAALGGLGYWQNSSRISKPQDPFARFLAEHTDLNNRNAGALADAFRGSDIGPADVVSMFNHVDRGLGFSNSETEEMALTAYMLQSGEEIVPRREESWFSRTGVHSREELFNTFDGLRDGARLDPGDALRVLSLAHDAGVDGPHAAELRNGMGSHVSSDVAATRMADQWRADHDIAEYE